MMIFLPSNFPFVSSFCLKSHEWPALADTVYTAENIYLPIKYVLELQNILL